RDRATWRACGSCGQLAPVSARDAPTGASLCWRCYQPPVDRCDRCGQVHPIRSRLSGQAICQRCYRGRWDTCHRCEDTTWCYRHQNQILCLRGVLAAKLTTMLTGPHGDISAEWRPLHELLTQAPHPRTQLRWLRHSEAARLVRTLVQQGQPPTHEALDAAAGSRTGTAAAVEHLRALLVSVGTLQERDNYLARLQVRLNTLITQAHPEDRTVLRRYATWQLIPRVRRASQRGRHTASRAYGARSALGSATHFAAWLRDHDASLATATQAHLDLYLTRHPRQASRVGPFLRWCRRHRFTHALDIPRIDYEPPRHRSTPRRDVLTSALTDDTWPIRERAAACLLLLYAQRPSTIVQLTTAARTTEDGTTFLTLGSVPIALPPRLAELVNALPENTRDGAAAAATTTEPWLFPGDRPGHHLDPTSLRLLLRRRGISPRPARNAALTDLASQVPVPALAKLLGLSTAAAEGWSITASNRWNGYSAKRIAHHNVDSPPRS
ncbi:MAG: hypothetical protein WCG47_19000, partial [Dermatophilaceae bacterium]